MAVPYGMAFGWAVHWAIHRRWTGFLYRAHLRHHSLYSPSDMESDSYRSSGTHNGLFTFVPTVTAALGVLLCLAWALGAPWWVYAAVVAESCAVGAAHELIHDSLHVRGHWISRTGRWHERVRRLHAVHHQDVRKNVGIFWFGIDRLLGTYRDP